MNKNYNLRCEFDSFSYVIKLGVWKIKKHFYLYIQQSNFF